MTDIDDIFDRSHHPRDDWRDRLTGAALELCKEVERRIEGGERPVYTKIKEGLTERGVTISSATVGAFYRNKYPHLRRDL